LSNAQSCPLNGSSKIQHVVYIQFDNVHFTRDNPNVPSDLEQMPHLLDFIKKHGTLLTNHHTPLISHTANDILTSLTGVYPEQHGQAVANSFAYFTPPGSQNFDGFSSSFAYWTDIVSATNDPTYNMITASGQNAPAPWVAFTRAGCDVGAVSIANIELENVSSDINNIFGPNSPEAQEAKAIGLRPLLISRELRFTVRLAAPCVLLQMEACQTYFHKNRMDTAVLTLFMGISLSRLSLAPMGL
jgi:hypothetical protein